MPNLLGTATPRAARSPRYSRVGHGLDIARDKLLGFGARIEGLTPSAVLALFGGDAAEEPAMLAGCAALAVQRAAKLTRK